MKAHPARIAGCAPYTPASFRGVGSMKDAFWIRLAQTIAARKYPDSGSQYSHRARCGRRARPLLDPLEERRLLSFGSPSLFDNGTGGGFNAAVAVGDVS